MTDEQSREVLAVAESIKPLLAGRPAVVQGAVLADLLSLWLAGHVDLRSQSNTAAVREELLSAHIEAVRALIAPNAPIAAPIATCAAMPEFFLTVNNERVVCDE